MGNPQNQPRSHRGSGRGKRKPIKITYISSPMKVKASSASEFRAIVQELTGCNSSPQSMDAWSLINNVDDAAHSISAINPITPMLDQAFVWREASDALPGFQFPFPCVFA